MNENKVVDALAVLGSALIPGLGQAMKGKFMEAIMFFVGFLISIVSMLFLIGFILVPIVWAMNVYHAYKA